MDGEGARRIQAAEVVLPCAELGETLAFFTARLGFRLESLRPADAVHAGVVRPRAARTAPASYVPAAELSLLVVLAGALTLRSRAHGAQRLGVGDACALPPDLACELAECTSDLQLLEVTAPARPS